MSADLKPCPFCGTTEGLYPSYRWPGTGDPYAVDCIGCGMEFIPREGMDVIAAWNRRDPADAKDAEISKLRDDLVALVMSDINAYALLTARVREAIEAEERGGSDA